MSSSKQLICLSTVPWSERTTRRQMIMSRMRDVRILYIDPPAGLQTVFARRQEPFEPYPHIRVYKPARVPKLANGMLPFPGAMKAFIESIVEKEEFDEPLLWLYSPLYLDAVKDISRKGLVYDCTETLHSIPGRQGPGYMRQKEKALCEAADVVFASQMSLFDRIEAYNKKTYLIPNGMDSRPKASLSDQSLSTIARLEELPKPIYGFAGALRRRVDFRMLEKLAAAGKSLLIVSEAGADEAAVKDEVEKLEAYENVLLIRAASASAILEYIRAFDVCVNPLTASGSGDELFMRVFFAYLASGKPIVTAPYPAIVKKYKDVADVFEVGDMFFDLVLTAGERMDMPRKERQLAHAKACNWDARVLEIRRLLAREGLLTD